MRNKVLSVFVDESGDFGQYNPSSPYYYDYGQIELAQILLSVFHTMFSCVEFRKIENNQYKLSQVADLICTVEAIAQKVVLTKSEVEFFHSKSDFKKNIYKNIVKKRV